MLFCSASLSFVALPLQNHNAASSVLLHQQCFQAGVISPGAKARPVRYGLNAVGPGQEHDAIGGAMNVPKAETGQDLPRNYDCMVKLVKLRPAGLLCVDATFIVGEGVGCCIDRDSHRPFQV